MRYSDRFEEGEFRKKIPFMYGGKLRKVKFKYSGLSIENVKLNNRWNRMRDYSDGMNGFERNVKRIVDCMIAVI